ncbi:MAG: hypothetical protein ACOYEB_13060 [Enterococcus lemanii]
MTEKVIGAPEVKTKTVALNDRDGVLDYTDALRGMPSYGTRALAFAFDYCGDSDAWTPLFTEIRNFLHGKRLKIFEPDDAAYYYMGRVEVGDPAGRVVKQFAISVVADTWKYKASGVTEISGEVAPGGALTLPNDWRPVVPDITVTDACAFERDGVSYALSGAGVFRIPQLALAPGDNVIEFTDGSGLITFRYQEGAL